MNPTPHPSHLFARLLLCAASLLALPATLYAQTAPVREYPLKHRPEGIDNMQFSFFYYEGGKVYNLRNFQVASGRAVQQLKVNPSGATYAVLDATAKGNTLGIYDAWKPNTLLRKVDCWPYAPQSVCYAADARSYYVGGNDGKVHCFSARDNFETTAISCAVTPVRLAVSPNGYYLVVGGQGGVEVLAAETRSRRALLPVSSSLTDMVFSADSRLMAVLTADGLCNIYDTRTFARTQTFDGLESALCGAFHPDGKYLAVATGGGSIALLNLLNPSDRTSIPVGADGAVFVRFLRDTHGVLHLAYSTGRSIVFTPADLHFTPNRQALLREELDSRMAEWVKRMDGESLDEYNARVNEDTRMEQIRLFETEIATRMAEPSLENLSPRAGNYNAEMGMLAIELGTMPGIYISVPADELPAFMEEGAMRLGNSRVCLNERDEFELVYTEVTNTRTGKTYVFDNTERRSLAYLENDDNFVPLSQLQLSQMEEIRLEEIRNDILETAKSSNVITDHTHIDVHTRVVKDNDATGRRITNYEIGVSYNVDSEYSSRDDYPSGHYRCEESNAAQAMLSVMKKALESDLSKYVVPGKMLCISITGMADATPFTGTVAYDGIYGDFEREPATKDGALTAVTVGRDTGISGNDQLAFLRAMGVRHYMEQSIPSLSAMDCRYETGIAVSDRAGSQFRRIGVKLTFVDAF